MTRGTPFRGRSDAGLTLLEVLVGLVILAVLAAGLATNTVSTLKTNTVSRDSTSASALVQDKIEQFRALDPSVNPADLTPGDHNDPDNPVTALGQPNGTFSRSWTVTADTPRRGVSQVVVFVTWTSPEARFIKGLTYICQSRTCS